MQGSNIADTITVCCILRQEGCSMSSMKRAALYVRVSTDAQTVENQIRELRQVAKRRGWDVVEVYSDAGISGAKGRNGRPGLDSMLKDASRRKFDIIIAWAIDRLGRAPSFYVWPPGRGDFLVS